VKQGRSDSVISWCPNRYTPSGWMAAADLTPAGLAGPGWRAISAPEAVAVQRAVTFGRHT